MNNNRNNLLHEGLRVGDHVCSIYKYSIEQILTTADFFIPALNKGIKCIYISSQTSRDLLIEEFDKRGVDSKRFIESGQLLLLDTKDVYHLTNNTMNTKLILKSIESMKEQAVKEGYISVKVVGELPLLLDKPIDGNSIVNYEQTIDKFIPAWKITAICQYNEMKYKPDILSKIIANHTHVEIYGNLYKNNSYKDYSGKSYKEMMDRIITG